MQGRLDDTEANRQQLVDELAQLRESFQENDAARAASTSATEARVAELEKDLAEAHGERERLLHRLQEAEEFGAVPSPLAAVREPAVTQPVDEFIDEKLQGALSALRRHEDAAPVDDDAMPTQMLPEEASPESPDAAWGRHEEADASPVEPALDEGASFDEDAAGGGYAATAEFTPGRFDAASLREESDAPESEGTLAWDGEASAPEHGAPATESFASLATESQASAEPSLVESAAEEDELDPSLRGGGSWLDQIEESPEELPEAKEASQFEPTNVLETLRKLQLEAPEDDVEEHYEVEPQPASAVEEEVSEPVAEEPPVDDAAPDGGEEEAGDVSIEDYMQRLIARTGGAAAPQPNVEAPTSAAPVEKAKPRPKPARPRRRAAPEATTDLAAMRQLANTTAKTAVASHAMRMARMHVGSKAIVALFCAGVGVALLTMGGGLFAIAAATGAFGMAAYTGFDIYRVWSRLYQINRSGGRPAAAKGAGGQAKRQPVAAAGRTQRADEAAPQATDK